MCFHEKVIGLKNPFSHQVTSKCYSVRVAGNHLLLGSKDQSCAKNMDNSAAAVILFIQVVHDCVRIHVNGICANVSICLEFSLLSEHAQQHDISLTAGTTFSGVEKWTHKDI